MIVSHSKHQWGSVHSHRRSQWHLWWYLYPLNHTTEHRETLKAFLWVSGKDGYKGFCSLFWKCRHWSSLGHFNFSSKFKAPFCKYLSYYAEQWKVPSVTFHDPEERMPDSILPFPLSFLKAYSRERGQLTCHYVYEEPTQSWKFWVEMHGCWAPWL